MRLRHALGALGAAALLTATVVAAPPAAHAASVTAQRVSGGDRYTTAVAVSRAAYPTPGSAGTVVIASGEGFADALSGGPVAAALGGPLLLTPKATLPSAVAGELSRLHPGRVVILGGTGAISAGVAAAVRALVADTTRVAGADRYETSREAVHLAFPDGADHLYAATGTTFPDALSGGALAAAEHAPLLIVPGSRRDADEATRALLDELGVDRVTVLGGTAAVSAGLASGLSAPGRTVERIAGADRYAVAGQIASRFPSAGSIVLVASGLDYPDALSAAALAARRSAPLLLTHPLCADAPLRSYVSAHHVATIVTIGGPGAVRGLVGGLATCQSTTDPRSPWVLVDKHEQLHPRTYAPSDLRGVKLPGGYSMRAEAASAMERMSAAARAAGVGSLGLASGYRSYSTQVAVYGNHVRTKGQARADQVSARPGYSEHQTGLAADVVACDPRCGGIDAFGPSRTGRWVTANAYRYGFVVRYEPGRTGITGYLSEPWHLRYVGTTLAADYHAGGFRTLEQYLGAPAAPAY